MPLLFDGAYGVPGLSTEKSTDEAVFTWEKPYNILYTNCYMDGAAADSGNSPTDILRPGLLLGRVTSTGKWKQWTPTATDGSEHIKGILAYALKMNEDSTATDRWIGWVIVSGPVKASQLLIPGAASRGINGDNNELLVRAQLTQCGRFIIDDELQGNPFGGWQRIVNADAIDTSNAYTVLESDNNTLFLNDIACEYTLPTPRKGYRFMFASIAAGNMIVTCTEKIIAFNNATADKVSFETDSEEIGGVIEILGVSTTQYLAIVHAYGLGATAQTVTVTDA